MEPKDIELKLNIKNYKAGKFLHLLALDSIEAFEKSHPNVIPLLLTSLKHGDPKKSLEMAERLEVIVEHLLKNAKSLKENIEKYMYSQLEEEFKKEGSGSKYITTSGNVGFALRKEKKPLRLTLTLAKKMKKNLTKLWKP